MAVTLVVTLNFIAPDGRYGLKDGLLGSPTSHWAAFDEALTRPLLDSLREVRLLLEAHGDTPLISDFLELGRNDLRASLPRLAASDVFLDVGRREFSEYPY